ncbi:MAG: Calx-beta domain-containing protein [Chloroflexota bacterium]
MVLTKTIKAKLQLFIVFSVAFASFFLGYSVIFSGQGYEVSPNILLAQTAINTPVTTPTVDQADVPVFGLLISAEFNQPVDFTEMRVRINGDNNFSGNITGKGTSTIIFTPTELVPDETVFTVSIFDITVNGQPFVGLDCDNNGDADDFCWSFTTAKPFVPTLSFDAPTYQVEEGNLKVPVTIHLDGVDNITTSATIQTVADSATGNVDFLSTSQQVIFVPGDTEETIEIDILDDSLVEPDESFKVTLTNIQNGQSGLVEALIIIEDTDVPVFNLNPLPQNTLAEDYGQLLVTVTKDRASYQNTQVDFQIGNGSATPVDDFTPIDGTIVFTPDQTSQTFSVTIVDDYTVEDAETFELRLANPQNGALGSQILQLVTINDNDVPLFNISPLLVDTVAESGGSLDLTIIMDKPSFQTTQVGYELGNGTATPGVDFAPISGSVEFMPGNTSQTLTIDIIADGVVESSETFYITLVSPVNGQLGSQTSQLVTISNDDFGPQLISTSPVDLANNVSVNRTQIDLVFDKAVTASVMTVSSNNGLDPVNGDFLGSGTDILSFVRNGAPFVNQTTYTVAVLDIVDLAGNMFEGLDCNNDGVAHDYCWTFTTFTPHISLSQAAYATSETSGVAQVAVTISGSSEETVSVVVETSDNTAVATEDYVAVQHTVQFLPGNTNAQLIDIGIIDDTDIEIIETFNVTLSNLVNGAFGDHTQAVVSISSEDAPPALTVSLAPTSVTINPGQTVDFTATISGGMPGYTIDWDFGDGVVINNGSTSEQHLFSNAGNFIVTVIVTDKENTIVSTTSQVAVIAPPVANFNPDSFIIFTGETVNFANLSTGIGTTYNWNFGDGGLSTDTSPSHTYGAPGIFNVNLVATNNGGSDSVSKQVKVIERTLSMAALQINTSEIVWPSQSTDSASFEMSGLLQMPANHDNTTLSGPIVFIISVGGQSGEDTLVLSFNNNTGSFFDASPANFTGIEIEYAELHWLPDARAEFLVSGVFNLPPAHGGTHPPVLTYAFLAEVRQGGQTDVIGEIRPVTHQVQGQSWIY